MISGGERGTKKNYKFLCIPLVLNIRKKYNILTKK